MKRVAPPPSDEQLAAAEQTDTIRRRDRLKAIEDQQEQERLAAAGEPESEEQIAVRASASVLESRPAEVEEPIDVQPTPPIARPKRKTRKNDPVRTAEAPTRGRGEILRDELGPLKTDPRDEESEEARDARRQKLAYKLMDLAYKKWAKMAEKDLPKANRALAIALGKDAVLYFQTGSIRMSDLHATIEKLTASAKQGKDNPTNEDFDDQLEEMRAALRDEG